MYNLLSFTCICFLYLSKKKRKDPIRLLSTSFNDKLLTTNTAEIQVQRMCFLYYDYEGLNLVVPQKKEKKKVGGGGVVDSHIPVSNSPTPSQKKKRVFTYSL